VAGFPWGKLIAATADEIADFGPNAARVKALLKMVPDVSLDAHRLSDQAGQAYLKTPKGKFGGVNLEAYVDEFGNADRREQMERAIYAGGSWLPSVNDAVGAESISDILIPHAGTDRFIDMVRPLATGRAFDLRRPKSPESFTSIARNLGDLGAVMGPRDIRAAQRLSMADPSFTQLVMSFVEDGMSLEDAMSAARALGI
jgi:hypothetical protein